MPQRSPKPPRLGAGGRALQRRSNALHQGTGAAARGRISSGALRTGRVRKWGSPVVMFFAMARGQSVTGGAGVTSLTHPCSILCLPHPISLILVLLACHPQIVPHHWWGMCCEHQARLARLLIQRVYGFAVLLLCELA